MLSGFKSFYSKSVDLLKQVQDTVVVGKPGGPAAPTVEPEDTHPGFHLVDRYERTWGEVVQNASNLSQTVAAEDAAVKRFADRCAESQSNWGLLQAELAALDGTQKAVAAVREDMEAMCAALKVLDEALDAHIQAKEERDMYKWKGGIEQKTAEFEAGRQADLEEMDKNLKSEQVRQEKLKKAEEDRILREIEARERREAVLQAEAARKEKAAAELAERKKQQAEQASILKSPLYSEAKAEAERKEKLAAERAKAEAERREKQALAEAERAKKEAERLEQEAIAAAQRAKEEADRKMAIARELSEKRAAQEAAEAAAKAAVAPVAQPDAAKPAGDTTAAPAAEESPQPSAAEQAAA